MQGIDLHFPKVLHSHALSASEHEAFTIRPRPKVSEWVQQNIVLNRAYVYPGRLRLFPWQVPMVDAIHDWRSVYYLFPPQMGKSTMADCVMYYGMTIIRTNGIVVYDRNETVKDVFKVRIKTMIQDNDCLRGLWDGVEDNLTMDNILLKSSLWRVGSAQNPATLSTFPAGMAICSELGKWPTVEYDPIDMIRGRGGAYTKKGGQIFIAESTSFAVGDYMYREVFKSGTKIVQAYMPCPHCGTYQVLTDSQIKMRPAIEKEIDKSPEKIRAMKSDAVYYECPFCHCEIQESARGDMEKDMVWAKVDYKNDDFDQKADEVRKNGTVVEKESRSYDAICFNASKLLDPAYPFWECLARFFESKNDPIKMLGYQTETMGRYWKLKSQQLHINYLEAHKDKSYCQYGETARIPDDVLVLTIGVDSQDNGFYYAIIGWMKYFAWRLIRHDMIHCPMVDYKDRYAVFKKVVSGIYTQPPLRKNGMEMRIQHGFIDRGGHRPEDVDFICERLHWLDPYVGLTQVDYRKPDLRKTNSGDGEFYLGQSELLSDQVGKLLEGADWFLPIDVGSDFLKQVNQHFHLDKVTKDGKRVTTWIKGPNDHYRSCLNLAFASAKLLNLDKILFRPNVDDTLIQRSIAQKGNQNPEETAGNAPKKPEQSEVDIQKKREILNPARRFSRRGGYFSRI